jgi:hypothetical protein
MGPWGGADVATAHGPNELEPLDQPLPGGNGLQPPHGAQPVLDGHVGALDRLRRLPARSVQSGPDVGRPPEASADGPPAGGVFVGDDHTRPPAPSGDGLLEEGAGAGQVAALPEEHVDHLAVLVHRPIPVGPLALDADGGLVRPPASPDRPRVPAPFGREQRAERVGPGEHRARGHIDVALGFGRLLEPARATPEAIREAARDILATPGYRLAAARLREELEAQPGMDHAVSLLERLVRERQPLTPPRPPGRPLP